MPDGRRWGLAGNPVAWFESLAGAMDREDLLDDPRFADPIDREANRSDLVELVTEWAATSVRPGVPGSGPAATSPLWGRTTELSWPMSWDWTMTGSTP